MIPPLYPMVRYERVPGVRGVMFGRYSGGPNHRFWGKIFFAIIIGLGCEVLISMIVEKFSV